MTKQEENWELMTTLQMPWSECNKIEDEGDRKFLLEKAEEVKEILVKQRQLQQQQAQQQQQQAQPQQGGGWTP